MRNLGIVLLLGGALGYFYFADQANETARYGCAIACVAGMVLAMFPKGR